MGRKPEALRRAIGILVCAFVPSAALAGVLLTIAIMSGQAGPLTSGGSIVWGVGLLCLYFLPPVIAYGRRHHQVSANFVLTLLLGWTALGWIAAMIWAFTHVRADKGQNHED